MHFPVIEWEILPGWLQVIVYHGEAPLSIRMNHLSLARLQ